MSSAKRRLIREMGALPGRKPGTRAMRANSLATFSVAFETSSAGISKSSSRRQVASAMQHSSLFFHLILIRVRLERGETGERLPCKSNPKYRRGHRERQFFD